MQLYRQPEGEEEMVEDRIYPIPETGGVYMHLCSSTGSKKGEEESMYHIPEDGRAYMEQYRQPEGGRGEYVSYT
jgi:hypothetical protein